MLFFKKVWQYPYLDLILVVLAMVLICSACDSESVTGSKSGPTWILMPEDSLTWADAANLNDSLNNYNCAAHVCDDMVLHPQGICPAGYSLPTIQDFENLIDTFANGYKSKTYSNMSQQDRDSLSVSAFVIADSFFARFPAMQYGIYWTSTVQNAEGANDTLDTALSFNSAIKRIPALKRYKQGHLICIERN